MNWTHRRRFAWPVLAIGVALALSACGGGGSSSSDTPTAASTLSGAVVKGPVSGATVSAYGVNPDGTMGAMLVSATTDVQGGFMLSIAGYTGPLLLKMNGGSYTDEATATKTNMGGEVMTAAIPALVAGTVIDNVHITPLTSMAEAMAERMGGGLSDANISSANRAVGAYFMVDDIVHTPPMNPLMPGSGAAAGAAMKHYGLVLAAMSQYAKQTGMISPAIVSWFTEDAADGVLDGMAHGSPIAMHGGMMGGGMRGDTRMPPDAGTHGMADAMSAFIASGFNASGVTAADMAALMQQLHSADGHMRDGHKP